MAKGNNIFYRFFGFVSLVVNIILAAGLIVSAYSGRIAPSEWHWAPLAVMTFGLWFAAIALIFILDLIWWRKNALIAGIAILICLPQVREFSPINLAKGSMTYDEKERAFSIMAYNVMQFSNQDKDSPFVSNEQLDYILDKSPDIVCIEEARCFSPYGTKITQEQLEAINQQYKYIYIEGEDLGLLSKFDTQPVHIDFEGDKSNGSIGAWRLNIHGETVNLFIVHLRSYKLSPEEKDLFSDATTPETTNRTYIHEAKIDLVPKVIDASIIREEQVERIIKIINKYGGKNTIVCGDFNEPVGSYALHRLEQMCSLKSAYAKVGFGPMITYNAHNMMFRIDHILYRGDLTPWSMGRGRIKASDHYPVYATFVCGD